METMTEEMLRAKGYRLLGEFVIIREDDYIEWDTNSFTAVSQYSLLVGKPVSSLKKVVGNLAIRPAKAFRLM
jgi:hypothetical protein